MKRTPSTETLPEVKQPDSVEVIESDVFGNIMFMLKGWAWDSVTAVVGPFITIIKYLIVYPILGFFPRTWLRAWDVDEDTAKTLGWFYETAMLGIVGFMIPGYSCPVLVNIQFGVMAMALWFMISGFVDHIKCPGPISSLVIFGLGGFISEQYALAKQERIQQHKTKLLQENEKGD